MFFNDTATTEIYTLSLHDALPIWVAESVGAAAEECLDKGGRVVAMAAAVRQLQTLCGLPANGSVDQTTWDHLCKLYALVSGDGDVVRL